MLNIGEFARLGEVSPRMLRHYDHVGLLTPERVDPDTGYRSYGVSQLVRLHRLLPLRDLGFTLHQIVELPVIEVASLVHRGPMDNVAAVYEDLIRWIEDSGYRLAGYSRELYHEMDAGGPNVTELQMPIAR